MGAGAAAGLAASVQSAGADDLKAAVNSMTEDNKKKLTDALEYVNHWQENKVHYGGNELLCAARCNLGRVRALLDEGAYKDCLGKALCAAAEDPVEGNAIGFLLLERGADPNWDGPDGYNSLFFVMDHGNIELLIKMLEHGATVEGDSNANVRRVFDSNSQIKDAFQGRLFKLAEMWGKASAEERDKEVAELKLSPEAKSY